MKNLLKFISAVGIAELAGGAGALFTMPAIESGWYAALEKPMLIPPSWVFGPVWITLYFLLGVSLYIVWTKNWKVENPLLDKTHRSWNKISERLWRGDWQKQNVIAIFAMNYLLNILWPAVFFGLKNPGLAFFVILALWASIVYLIANFYRVSKLSAWLLLPYLAWVSFAVYLNFSIWILNF